MNIDQILQEPHKPAFVRVRDGEDAMKKLATTEVTALNSIVPDLKTLQVTHQNFTSYLFVFPDKIRTPVQ